MSDTRRQEREMGAFSLEATFLHLDDKGGTAPLPVTDTFWEAFNPCLEQGRLISVLASDGDWSNWEMHPSGDEVIYFLSGEMTLVLDDGGEDYRTNRMQVGEATVVPRGTWHTADVKAPSKAMYITCGRGTEGRPRS